MLDFEFDRMLFNIPVNEHKPEKITEILTNHPEVKFVSLVGIDIGGHDTDEKNSRGINSSEALKKYWLMEYRPMEAQ